MDGVVTDTAAVHVAAWAELFDAVLADPARAARCHVQRPPRLTAAEEATAADIYVRIDDEQHQLRGGDAPEVQL